MAGIPPPGREVPSPGDTIGGYRLRQHLHLGSAGPVYVGIHPVSGRKVVVRVIDRLRGDADALARFQEEAERIRGIDHPGVVRLLSADALPDGGLFTISEFTAGRTLADLLAPGARLAAADAAALIDALAGVLEQMHRRGVVHGNLSPSKVFLLRAEGDDWPPRVKIADFGRPRLLSPAGPEGATTAYRAPEQLRGELADERSDIFALGAIAHHLVAGRPPLRTTAEGDPTQQRIDWIERALQEEPEARYQTMAQLRAALRLMIGSRPARAAPSVVEIPLEDRSSSGRELHRGGEPTSVAAEVAKRPSRHRLPLWALLWLVGVALLGGTLYRVVAGHWPLAAERAHGRRGVVELVSVPPGAQIHVDRAPWPRRTPTAVPVIRGRPYEVYIYRRGYLPSRQRVALGTAEPSRRIVVQLARKPQGWGTLQLTANVKVDVVLDARRVGTEVTELTLADVRAGVGHRLRLSAPGHRSVEQVVRVEAGKVRVLQFELRPVDTPAAAK